MTHSFKKFSKFFKLYRKLKPRTTFFKIVKKFAYTMSYTLDFIGWRVNV